MRTSLLGYFLLATAPLGAQRVTLTAPADLLHAPNGRIIATLRTGAAVSTGPARSGFVQVTVQGYVPSRVLGPARDSFPVTIKDAAADLRSAAQAGAQSIASLRQGMGLMQSQRAGDWLLVSRTGWIRESAVKAPAAAATKGPPPPATKAAGASGASSRPTPAPAATTATTVASRAPASGSLKSPAEPGAAPSPSGPVIDSTDLIAPNGGALRDAPSGRVIATLGDSARMHALHRDRGWVRVRIEAWVRDADVTESDTALRAALLPADLRADPAATRGKLVRWDVQKLAIQNADPLQRDLAQNEPYMLARGPGADHPLLYLSLPPSLLASARNLPALGFFTVIARVRNGRSSPGGVPILDVVSLTTK